MNNAHVAVLRVLLQAALEKCVDAEHHSPGVDLDRLRTVRLRISIAIATLDSRGRGGQSASPAPLAHHGLIT